LTFDNQRVDLIRELVRGKIEVEALSVCAQSLAGAL
jgi:hypothetical protein